MTAATRPQHSFRSALAVLALAVLATACEAPATGVLVVIGTDLDPALPLTVTARLTRGLDGGDGRVAGPWTRIAPGAEAVDGGVTLPLSFGVVPGENPVDEPVGVVVEGVAGGVTLRRRAVFTFVPRQTGVLRVFLTQRCAEPAEGCVEPVRCTVQQRCEEQGLTCGNDGLCVAIRAPLSGDPDASFGDVAPTAACGAYGERCCPLGPACGGANTCVEGTCRRCADPGQRCCDGERLRPNGAVCAPTDNPCRAPGTCADGLCGAVADAPDGTACGAAAGPCALAPVCMGGACTTRSAPDGTACGAAAGPCALAPVCMGGACSPRSAPDGTVCGAAPDACRRAPVCGGGSCLAPAAVANGTVCGAAADACHLTSVCAGGACSPRDAPNGTVCGAAGGPCLRARVCGGGACLAAAAVPNGTVCEGARNPCEDAAVCTGGRCGGHAARPEDSPWGGGGFNRCCGGQAVVVNTAARCGGCRIACRSGSCRAALGRYYCGCSSNAQCAPGICRTQSPNANLCACENNGDCPAGMPCVNVSFNPNYCSL
jgi:hypothetical protein